MTTRQRIVRAAAAAMAATALTALYLHAVHITGTMPRCLFKLATGLSCPGCGSQRALNALLHGNLREAVEVNMLLPAGIAYLAVLGVTWLFQDTPAMRRTHDRITSPAALITVTATIILWTIIRNLAGI